MKVIEVIVDGVKNVIQLSFSRRRYGNVTYTWVYASSENHKNVSLGDPWPAITPKRLEIEAVIINKINSKEL